MRIAIVADSHPALSSLVTKLIRGGYEISLLSLSDDVPRHRRLRVITGSITDNLPAVLRQAHAVIYLPATRSTAANSTALLRQLIAAMQAHHLKRLIVGAEAVPEAGLTVLQQSAIDWSIVHADELNSCFSDTAKRAWASSVVEQMTDAGQLFSIAYFSYHAA